MPVSPGSEDVDILLGDEVYVRADGQPTVAPLVLMPKDRMDAYRQGYICCKCHGVQSEPMPEVCEFGGEWQGVKWGCGFHIRDDQARLMAAGDRGETDVTYIEPEERFDYEQEQWKRSEGGILVPGHAGLSAP